MKQQNARTPHCPHTDTERAGAPNAKATPREANTDFIVKIWFWGQNEDQVVLPAIL